MFDLGYWLGVLSAIQYMFVMACCYNVTLNKQKPFTLKDWFVILIISLFVSANTLYIKGFLIMPGSIVLTLALFYFIFCETGVKLLYKTFFICILSIITDLLLSIVLSFLVEDFQILNTHIFLKLVYSMASGVFLFFSFRLKIVKWAQHKIGNLFFQNRNIIFISFLVFIFTFYCYFLYNLDYSNFIIYILNVLVLVALMLFIFYYFKEIYDNKLLGLKNKYLEENLDLFKNTLEQYRELKHNVINDFLFVKTILPADKHELLDLKMTKYYSDQAIMDDVKTVPSGLQGLIYVKTRLAKKVNVDFAIDSNVDIDYKKMNYKLYIDLCEIMGIVLDNAIEAAKDASPKVVYLNSRLAGKKIVVEIINTFTNDIDLEKLGDKNYSTKNRGSGLGLNYIMNLNKKIEIEKEIIDSLFIVVIRINDITAVIPK